MKKKCGRALARGGKVLMYNVQELFMPGYYELAYGARHCGFFKAAAWVWASLLRANFLFVRGSGYFPAREVGISPLQAGKATGKSSKALRYFFWQRFTQAHARPCGPLGPGNRVHTKFHGNGLPCRGQPRGPKALAAYMEATLPAQSGRNPTRHCRICTQAIPRHGKGGGNCYVGLH